MNSFYHARSSMRKWGGRISDYKEIHDFLDHTKAHVADMRHRAILHNSWGIYIVETIFGDTIDVAGEYTTKQVPTRLIAERHVIEDLGFIPSLDTYLSQMELQAWMKGGGQTSTTSEVPSLEEALGRFTA